MTYLCINEGSINNAKKSLHKVIFDKMAFFLLSVLFHLISLVCSPQDQPSKTPVTRTLDYNSVLFQFCCCNKNTLAKSNTGEHRIYLTYSSGGGDKVHMAGKAQKEGM